jgi:hypothetical protein
MLNLYCILTTTQIYVKIVPGMVNQHYHLILSFQSAKTVSFLTEEFLQIRRNRGIKRVQIC